MAKKDKSVEDGRLTLVMYDACVIIAKAHYRRRARPYDKWEKLDPRVQEAHIKDAAAIVEALFDAGYTISLPS